MDFVIGILEAGVEGGAHKGNINAYKIKTGLSRVPVTSHGRGNVTERQQGAGIGFLQ